MTDEETTALPALFEPAPASTLGDGFDIVRRGYDRLQVDAAVSAFRARVEEQEAQLKALDEVLMSTRLEADQANAQLARAGKPTFEALGDRVTEILALAEQEAAELRSGATADAERERREAEEEAARVRTMAQRDAFEVAEQTRLRVADLERHERELLQRLADVRDTLAQVTASRSSMTSGP